MGRILIEHYLPLLRNEDVEAAWDVLLRAEILVPSRIV